MSFLLKNSTFAVLFTLAATSLAAQNVRNPEHIAFRQGMELYDNGFFEEAIVRFNRFKDLNKNNKELYESADFRLARAHAAADSAGIEHYYYQFILSYPSSQNAVRLLKDLGDRYTRSGDYEAAIEFYEKTLPLIKDSKTAAEIRYWIAESAAENGQNNLSRSYFQSVADEYPKSEWAPKALYARGRLYLTDNKFDSSSVAFEELEARYPGDPMTKRIGTALGEAYYQQAKYEQAIKALDDAYFNLDEESKIKAQFLMAESYNYLGNFEESKKAYMQYANMTKGTEQARNAHYGLGWLYYKEGIYHWAAEEFGKADAGDDEIARKALYYKAVNQKLAAQYERSYKTFAEFSERFKTGLWVETAMYEWGVSAFQSGRYEEAIDILLDLIRNQKELEDGGKVYVLLGEAYFANNEFTRAIQAFEYAESISDVGPDLRRQARFQKAWILYRNQAYSEAQPIFESVYAEVSKTDIGAESLFWSADSYYHSGQYAQAARRFETFLQNYPDHEMIGAARYSLGWSYFIMGEYGKATAPFEAFLAAYDPPPVALFPYDTDTQLRIGDAYYAQGKYNESLKYYNMAIGAEPGGDYAMFQVANSYYRANRTFQAITTFRRMLRIYPFSSLREQAQYNVAYIYLNTENYSQALEEFQTVINKYPGTEWAARSQYNIGDTYYNAGDFEEAIEAYKKVLSDYPKSQYIIDAVNGIQFAQLSSGGDDSSSEVLEDFLSDNPNSSTADRLRYRQAENVYQAGDYEGAIKEFRQYLRITNSDNMVPLAYANLGDAYLQTNQPEQAMEAYKYIADNFPNDEQASPALAALGSLYYDQGDYKTSHSYYEQLLARAPRFRQEAYVGMGTASLAQNELSKAKDEFEEALSVNPGSGSANVGLGKVALAEGDYAGAKTILRSVAESNTTQAGAEAQYYLGEAEQKQGNYEQAIEEYSKVRVLFEAFEDWVSGALYNTAECHIRLGNTGDARNILRGIGEKYPGTEAAAKAQKLLEASSGR